MFQTRFLLSLDWPLL